MYSASAFAANTVVRSAVAAAFPLFTVQMFTNVSPAVALNTYLINQSDTFIDRCELAGTLVGLVALVLAPMPFLFYKYGARIRASSKFAPCIVSVPSWITCAISFADDLRICRIFAL
jgi:MFS transporter, DHA1 family, multidrug resistance protein